MGQPEAESSKTGNARRRVAGALPYLPIFLPAALAFLYVRSFGVNVAFWDQWEIVPPLFDELFSGTLGFSDLFAQYNEHRILFPRIAMLLLGVITAYNTVAEMYLILACFAATLVVLLLAFKLDSRYRLLLFLPVPFLLFSLRHYENMLNGVQIVVAFVVMFGVLAFYCLHVSISKEAGLRKVAFPAALASGTVASFSAPQGLLVWPIGLLQLLVAPVGRPAKRLMMGVWGSIGLAEWIAYFVGYVKPADHPPLTYALLHPVVGVEYLLTLLGSALFWQQGSAFVGGLLLAFLAAVVVGMIFKEGRLGERSFWLALLLFSSLILGSIAVGRTGFGIEQAMVPRDAIFSLLFVIGVYGLLAKPAVERGSRVLKVLLGGLAGLVVLSVSVSYAEGMKEGRVVEASLKKQAFILSTYQTQPDEALEILFPAPELLRERAHLLEGLGYNVFSEPQGEGSLPPLSELSPISSPALSEIEAVDGQSVEQEQPVVVPEGKQFITVTGWAVDDRAEEAAGGVYVEVDGKLFPASYGTRKGRVARYYEEPAYRNSGFEGTIPGGTGIGAGTHELSIVVLSHDGEGYYRGDQKVILELE